MIEDNKTLPIILKNIEYARKISRENQSINVVIVVSGNKLDKDTWQQRLDHNNQYLFNSNSSTKILSFQEKIGKKRKEGNFLGTLLAYIKLKDSAQRENFSFRESVTLIGMLFGRGERMSPFTQIEGDRKPAIIVSSRSTGDGKLFTAIEEALFYFVPVAKYLEQRGFRGVLNKWGDETEIPSIDLTKVPGKESEFDNYDVIKCISTMRITEELARQKEWILTGSNDSITAIISRDERSRIIEILRQFNIKPDENGDYYAGVSLGPVAVSYDVLDIAVEVFDHEIYQEGIYIDFDPFFILALSITSGNFYLWEEAEERDKGLQKLLSKVPDFFSKVQLLKNKFKLRHGRKLRLKILDLGEDVFWADIGQHKSMREKYMSINEQSIRGIIARELEYINEDRDQEGNIIINSRIDPGITVKQSVIINSQLTGNGLIEQSVIKDSILHNPQCVKAFSVLSCRYHGNTILLAESGLYRSIGNKDLELKPGMRHGTIITKSQVYDMMVSESTNLRDRDNFYRSPVFGNKLSFAEAYDEMFGVGEVELDERRKHLVGRLTAQKE
jgi:hypothetical protein